LAVQLLSPTLSKLGYAPDQGGLFQWVAASAAAGKEDPDVLAMATAMRDRVIPPAMVRNAGLHAAALVRPDALSRSCPWSLP